MNYDLCQRLFHSEDIQEARVKANHKIVFQFSNFEIEMIYSKN